MDTISDLEKAVHDEPSNRDHLRRLADGYFSVMQRYPDALKLYCELLATDSGDHDALLKIGTICMALGRELDAVHFFQKLIKIDNWNMEAWKYIEQFIEKRMASGSAAAHPVVVPEKRSARSIDSERNQKAVTAIRRSTNASLTSIIILTWNQLKFTQACMASIHEHTPEPHEIIFVDNGSTDGTVAWLKGLIGNHPNYHLIENNKNLGFAGGNNCGISLARGDFVLLLNNDTVVTPGWLKSLTAVAEKDERVGLVGPKSNHVPGPQQVERIDYDPETLDGLEPFSRKWAERWHGKSMPHWRIVGFCMLIKKKVIETIGGFDPRFAIGNFEDDDFCLRAHVAGFSARIAEECFVHHYGAQTFKGNGVDHAATMARNWGLFKEKWGLAPQADVRCAYTVATGQISFDERIHYVPVNNTDRTRDQARAEASTSAAGCLNASGPYNPPAGWDGKHVPAASGEGTQWQLSAEAMYAQAIQTVQSGEYQKAIAELEKLVDVHPDFALAHNDLGVLYYNTGDKNHALRHYEKSVQLQPHHATFQKNLADFYFIEKNRAEDALRIYVDVLEKNPGDMEGLLATARICERLGKFEDAQGFYRRVLGHDPNHDEAHGRLKALADETLERPAASHLRNIYEVALHRAGSGDIQTAVEKLNDLLSADPGHAAAWNDLGVLYYQIGDKLHARVCYERAVKFEPENITFAKNLADFYYIEQGRLEDALQVYQNVIRVADRDIESLTAAGRICAALKYYEESRRYYERVRSIDTTNEEASREIDRLGRFQKIALLLQQERSGEAMDAIEQAIVDFGVDDGMLKAALAVREKIGPMETQSATIAHTNVSLCMIVKEEEEDLPACLHHLKPFVDEMIIVDTGSKDRTKDLAVAFGAKVFETPWENDFSKARNLSISKATGKWILIMDADEVLSAADLDRFKQITCPADFQPRAYSMQKRHYTHSSNLIGWQPNQGEYPAEEKGTGWCSSRLVRLFPNDSRVRFSFPVHELVEPSLKKLNIEIRDCEIPIHHYGKLREGRAHEKIKNYQVLEKKKIKQCQRDSAAIRELAIQCAHLGQHAEAIHLWKEYLKKEPRAVEAFLNMGTSCWSLGRYAEAARFAEKALRINPAMKEAGFNRAVALLMMGRAAETKSILQSVLEKQPNYPAAQFMLCVAHACLGEQPEVDGVLSTLKSLPMSKYLHVSFLDIAKKFVSASRCDYARSTLETALNLGCANPEMVDFLESCRTAA